jgi:hypothetical protein
MLCLLIFEVNWCLSSIVLFVIVNHANIVPTVTFVKFLYDEQLPSFLGITIITGAVAFAVLLT